MKINKNICIGISVVLLISIIIIFVICYFSKNHFSNLNDSNDINYEDFINKILKLSSFNYNSNLDYIDLFNAQTVNGLWFIDRNYNILLDSHNYSFSYNSELLLVKTNNNNSKYLLNTIYFTKDHFDDLKNFMNKSENKDKDKFQPKDYTDLSKGWRIACNIEGQFKNGDIGVCCGKLVVNDNTCVKKSS